MADAEGKVQGHFEATGMVPKCVDQISVTGIDLPSNLFERGAKFMGVSES